jgi:predicted Zn-dependent peptidase
MIASGSNAALQRMIVVLGTLAALHLPSSPAAAQSFAADTAAHAFKVGALQVLHQQRTGSETVAIRLFLLGGARQIDARTAGIEPLLLRAAGFGTERYPGPGSAHALARTGSTIGVEAEDDWTILTLRTIRSELDSAFAVFADRVAHPTLSDGSIEEARRQLLADLLVASANPDFLLQQIARPIGFARHPYANSPGGSDASLRGIRATTVRDYHTASFVTSRMLLVVVGNVDRPTVERLAQSFGSLPAGSYAWTLPPPVPMRPTSMTIIPRALATDYIIGIYPGPLANAREAGPFRVGTGLVGALLNREVREQEQLSYAAFAPLYDNLALGGALYASTTNPERVMELMFKQVEFVASDGIPVAYLPRFVSQFEISDLTERASAVGHARALGRAYLVYGDVNAVGAAFASVKGSSASSLRVVAGRYIPSVQFIFMGDTARFRKFMR